MAKPGPKGPRAKVMRVLLIEGHPDCLYCEKVENYYTLIWKDRSFSLGKCGSDIAAALKEMNTYAQVSSRVKKFQRTISLPEGIHASVKKVSGNTHILVRAVSDNGLAEEIEKVKRFLENKGVKIIERCHWTCDFDPGSKAAPKPAPVQGPAPKHTPAPVVLPNGPGKFFCRTHGKDVLMPRDCDYCIVKKQCGEFEEFKKKIEVDKNAIRS